MSCLATTKNCNINTTVFRKPWHFLWIKHQQPWTSFFKNRAREKNEPILSSRRRPVVCGWCLGQRPWTNQKGSSCCFLLFSLKSRPPNPCSLRYYILYSEGVWGDFVPLFSLCMMDWPGLDDQAVPVNPQLHLAWCTAGIAV